MAITYRPLDASKREFRLLEIQPAGSISDPVHCRIVTARLTEKEKPDYIALSSLYSDDTPDTDRIIVNGRSVTIPNHISQALRHVRAVFFPTVSLHFQRKPKRRPHKAPRWLRELFGLEGSSASSPSSGRGEGYGPGATTLLLWIDLLCVNHMDDIEKSQQVAGMRKIYRHAELVVGWLGVKTEHTDAGMEVLGFIDETMPPHWGDPGDREKHPEDYAPIHQWAAPLKDIWTAGVHWVGGADFFMRPYLQRRWILEELSTARYPVFLIGDIIMPWKQLLRLTTLMEEFKYEPSKFFPRVRNNTLPGQTNEYSKANNMYRKWCRVSSNSRSKRRRNSSRSLPGGRQERIPRSSSRRRTENRPRPSPPGKRHVIHDAGSDWNEKHEDNPKKKKGSMICVVDF